MAEPVRRRRSVSPRTTSAIFAPHSAARSSCPCCGRRRPLAYRARTVRGRHHAFGWCAPLEGRRDFVTAARTIQVEDMAVSPDGKPAPARTSVRIVRRAARPGLERSGRSEGPGQLAVLGPAAQCPVLTSVLAERVMRLSEPPGRLAGRLQESGAVSAHANGIGCSSDMTKKVRHAVVLCRRGGVRGSPLGRRPNRARPRAGGCRRQRSRARGEGARLPGPEANARRAVRGPAGWQAVAHATRRPLRRRASLWASWRSQVPAAKPVSAPSNRRSADGCTATRVNPIRDLMLTREARHARHGTAGACRPSFPAEAVRS